MYNASTIKTELIGLLGWRQNEDSSGTQLTSLTTSSSGQYYNDIHPLLTIDNLLSIAPEYSRLHSGDQSAENTAFTNWLQQKTEAGIIQAIQTWINRKFEVKTAKNLLERNVLFDTSGRIQGKDVNNSLVVGLEIIPPKTRSVQTKIESIGIQLDTNQSVTVNLFHSQSNVAVQTQAITYSGSGGLQWQTVDWTLDGTGTYFVAYDQSAITGQSVNGAPNYTYHDRGLTKFPTGKFYQATAFTNSGSFASMWDTSSNSYTTSTNYGLNLKLNVQCDYTSFITEQKTLFQDVVGLQVAINLIREMVYNPNSRINRNQSNVSKNEVLFELEGDTQGPRPGGVMDRLNKSIDTITFDDSQIDRYCSPCRRRAVKYKSVG